METKSFVFPTIDVENEDQIEYASHVHPLTLCEIDDNRVYCSMCRERCLGRRTYGCNPCGLFLHEPCTKIDIPQEIYHDFHFHPLRLAMKKYSSSCRACGDSSPGLMFECYSCEFYMDVECALLPTKLEQDECIDHIQHFKHPHPLILCDDEKKYEKQLCRGCGVGLKTRPPFPYDYTSLLSNESESIYGCLHLRCGFFLHERCARLPLEIDSPFHPGHSLELIWSFSNYSICQGCHQRCMNRYSYQCRGSCNFILGVECAFLKAPILKFESHEHLLTLFPSVSQYLSCHICNETCGVSKIFRCVECDYNLHLHCGPLPCFIKDKCHIDPLKLMYDFVEEGYEDDIVYCDACEKPRDPDQCVYCCKDCNFIAELKCVEDEVLRSLNGERGNVKLRTANKTRIQVGAKLISNVIVDNVETDNDNETDDIGPKYLEVELYENFLPCCYTDEECEQLIEIFKKARVQSRPTPSIFQESYEALRARAELEELQSKRERDQLNISICCYSSDEESNNAIAEPYFVAFDQLMRNLDSSYYLDDKLLEPYSDDKHLIRNLDYYYGNYELLEIFFRRDYNIVRIGKHKIVQDSATVLKGLLHKYGDFTVKSKLSGRLKVIFLTMFCEVIHNMCLTNVREVDQNLLRKWWKSLKLVQHAGFEIMFAIDQLYKVVQASFGMQAITSYREKKSRVDTISNEVEEEEEELEAKKRHLEDKKRQLEELKSDVEKDKCGIEYQSSPVLKECLKHVAELKWKKSWDGSPIISP